MVCGCKTELSARACAGVSRRRICGGGLCFLAVHRAAAGVWPLAGACGQLSIWINCFKNLEKTQALWAAATSENQNFFLQKEKNGGREIHLRGYEPTAYYSNSYAGEAGGNMRTDIKYCSTDNFVWGIKIPVAIPHPIEKIDIMQVYSKFRSWITEPNHSDPSSPDFNENWFKYYDTSKVIG